jgi:hypothetical protein
MQVRLEPLQNKQKFTPFNIVLTIETLQDAILLHDKFLAETPFAVVCSEVFNAICSAKKQ